MRVVATWAIDWLEGAGRAGVAHLDLTYLLFALYLRTQMQKRGLGLEQVEVLEITEGEKAPESKQKKRLESEVAPELRKKRPPGRGKAMG